jgi:two-component system, OmpR family, sensor histidine kinase BaeS
LTERRLLSPLGLRLAVAFVSVAVLAVVLLSLLTLVSTRGEVDDLVQRVRRDDAAAAAAEAGRAYATAGGWRGAPLDGMAAVAARGRASVTVLDELGRVVAAPDDRVGEMTAAMHGHQMMQARRGEPVTAPVVVDGRRVGSVELRFPAGSRHRTEAQVWEAMARNIVFGGLLAAGVAVAVAVFVARRLSRPMESLTEAAQRIEAGERDVRADVDAGPGELGTLAAAFNRMSSAVSREEELRRNLVHDVAHEVRTPLTILRATTEGMVDGVIPPDRQTLHDLHEEVLRLTSLVGDLEALAAAEAASLGLRAGHLDLADVGRRAASLATSAAQAAGDAVSLALEPAPTLGDEERLTQVAVNLVVNALRHTPPGTRITVRTGVQDDRPYLEVADNGPGIDERDLPHLFDRFYRGSAVGAASGSGIGLAVASELVRAHGGRITVTNGAAGGASFRVVLPSAGSAKPTRTGPRPIDPQAPVVE